jgi:hypothetical protein
MCSHTRVYLICTNRKCSKIVDRRSAFEHCPSGKRRAWRRSAIRLAAINVRYRLQLAMKPPDPPEPPEAYPPRPAKPCRACRYVAVSAHFAYLFSFCDDCLKRETKDGGPPDPARQLANRDSAWGVLPAADMISPAVSYADFHSRMDKAGAKEHLITAVVQPLEEQLEAAVKEHFMKVQGGFSIGPAHPQSKDRGGTNNHPDGSRHENDHGLVNGSSHESDSASCSKTIRGNGSQHASSCGDCSRSERASIADVHRKPANRNVRSSRTFLSSEPPMISQVASPEQIAYHATMYTSRA